MFDYYYLKSWAKLDGCKINQLLALAPQNDPFYTGSPAEEEGARWFIDLWNRFGYKTGIHLRRVHYQIVSQDPPVLRPNGKPYENTENDWRFLTNAGKWARYLWLVDPDAFIDRRNPEAIIHAEWDAQADPDPDYEATEGSTFYDYNLPDLPQLPSLPRVLPNLPGLYASGYDEIQQPYHVEVWAEKSTMNDVLEPICGRYNANLITGLGELSITAVRQFLLRVAEIGRPARILYISDFDPAGLGMPNSVARKIEFYQRNDSFEDIDIALDPIVLTTDQVKTYRLPRVPVKDTDLRKANFEAAHGEGQVELDALEALYPGELAKIVTQAVLRYYDPDLRLKAERQKEALQDELNSEWQDIADNYHDELINLESDYQALVMDFDKTRAEFAELVKQFQPKIDAHRESLAAITERAKETYGKLYADLEAVDVDLDDYPLPEPDIAGDPYGLLYASGRDYFEQLQAYKAQRFGADYEF